MTHSLTVTEFLSAPGLLLDVRSPAEYAQGHIPGAVSFPLFSNEERAQVGTCYKQQGRELAIELGLKLVGPKLADFVTWAKQLAPDRRVRIHCWRGGMRSGSMGWLLETAGFEVSLLVGGYKAFRRWALEQFERPRPILMVGGMTGSGKTDILKALAEQGAQTLDLEQLAHHRGSSFGALGMLPQPSTEHFENRIAVAWAGFRSQQPVWIEAESKRVGTCRIPEALFQQMDRAPVLEIVRSRAERLNYLVQIYGTADRQELIVATERIRKRLGGVRTQQAVDLIQQGRLAEASDLILEYYDKTYRYDLQRRAVEIYSIDVAGLSAAAAAERLLKQAALLTQPHQPLASC